ncbi:MAG: hypothetical protein Q9162_001017 [Coniocarpon cinnabarinum]
METPPAAPAHQFQAQNTQYPPPESQYGPVHAAHQSQSLSQTPALPPEPKPVTASSLHPPKERTRHSSACFPCAKRKVKCDRDVKNPCSNCLKRDQPHLCEVKSQKDRLSHRASDPGGRDGHRDKRPKFEAFQSTFRSTPAASNGGYVPAPGNEEAYTMSPPQARMTVDYGPPEYNPPRAHRTSVSMIAPKTEEEARWLAVADLLPQKRDLLKYIGTYKNNGPHFINPVTLDCDVFESQACVLLTEMETPQIRDRFGETNPGAELELTRLARLLAVLATGSRVEDSDPVLQANVAQDYVRKSFRCLQLANYMLRPTTETIETLLLLSQELLNEHQPSLAWTVIGTATRLSQLLELSPPPHQNGQYIDTSLRSPPNRATSLNSALSDTIISTYLHSCTPAHLSALQRHVDEAPFSSGLDLPEMLAQLYALIPDPAVAPPRRTPHGPEQQPFLHPDHLPHFEHQLDNLLRRFKLAEIANCKSIRDRYEHYMLRLHASYVSALVARPVLGERGLSIENQDTSAGRSLTNTYATTLQLYLDFAGISALPLRTWSLTHIALSAALALASINPSPDSAVMISSLPRLLQVLDSSGSVLSRRQADAVRVLRRVVGERGIDLSRDLREVESYAGEGDEGYGQGLWGL